MTRLGRTALRFLAAFGLLWQPPAHAGTFDCLIEPRRTVDIRAASEGLITNPQNIGRALAGETGTRISRA